MQITTKHDKGDTIKFHPFGKKELILSVIIVGAEIFVKKNNTVINYLAEDNKKEVWVVTETNIITEETG